MVDMDQRDVKKRKEEYHRNTFFSYIWKRILIQNFNLMRRNISILFAAACTAALSLLPLSVEASVPQGDDPIVKKVMALAAEDNQTMDHLDIVTNRFGGRPIGSDAYTHATDWAVYMFEKWGLEVHKEYAGEVSVGFNRGPWFGRMINGNEALHFTTPSYTAGTKGLQRGHVVIEPKTRAEFERMKQTIKGAWVLIGGTSKGWPIDYTERGDAKRAEIIAQNDSISQLNAEIRQYNSSIFNQKRNLDKQLQITKSAKEAAKIKAKIESLKEKELIPLIEEPALFYREMLEAGALGIIQSAPVPITTLYDRANIDNGYMTWDNLPTLPDIKLDFRQYNKIKEMVELREYVELEFDIRNHFYMGPVPYYNVVAILRGTEFPDEYVICGGHLDSYDAATGGVDCGTGIAPTMEAARLLATAGAKPKRSIIFALWAGEEFGLLGSKAWVEQHQEEMPNIVNYFNRDGGPTVANSMSVPKEWYDALVPICEPLKDLDPRFPFKLSVNDRYPMAIPDNAGGSDHAYFMMSGVPVIGFGTGDPLGYNFSYGEIWHTDRDLYTKSIPEYMEHTSIVNAIVLWGIANLPEKLPADAVYIQE